MKKLFWAILAILIIILVAAFIFPPIRETIITGIIAVTGPVGETVGTAWNVVITNPIYQQYALAIGVVIGMVLLFSLQQLYKKKILPHLPTKQKQESIYAGASTTPTVIAYAPPTTAPTAVPSQPPQPEPKKETAKAEA